MNNPLFSLMLLIAAGAMVFLKVTPAMTDIELLAQEKSALEALLTEMKSLIDKESQLKAIYAGISEDDLAKVLALAPADPKLAEYIVKINMIASKNGVFIPSIGVTRAARSDLAAAGESFTGKEMFLASPLTIGLEGTYESIKSFLREIEIFVRITDFEGISFSDVKSGADIIRTSVNGKIYQSR